MIPSVVAVVFNPSKASDADKAKREICDALLSNGFPQPRWFETTVDDPGTGVCRQAVADGAELIVVSGGDGTVMACVTALAGGPVPLAVLAAGTGNLLARNFGIPHDLKQAAAVAAQDHRLTIDVGTLGDRRFAIMAGMGFDAQMLADAPESLKAKVGWPAYILSGARHLLERRHTFTLTLDGQEPLERKGRGVLVGNVGKLQGGLPVLPDADPRGRAARRRRDPAQGPAELGCAGGARGAAPWRPAAARDVAGPPGDGALRRHAADRGRRRGDRRCRRPSRSAWCQAVCS